MKGKEKLSKSAASGIVALIFLILGFQAALFVTKVINKPVEVEEEISEESSFEKKPFFEDGEGTNNKKSVSKNKSFTGNKTGKNMIQLRPSKLIKKHKPELFFFNPNIVTGDELVRLGFSEKQSDVILNYRSKGGRFRRKSDFKKMYVVTDSVFNRLENYISIPKTDLNTADSTALIELPGIGPYYAQKIIAYRKKLGSFAFKEQLLEIEGINEEKFLEMEECISLDSSLIRKFSIWEMSDDSLKIHPYIGSFSSKGIIRYKSVFDSLQWSVDSLIKNNIISQENGEKLKIYQK